VTRKTINTVENGRYVPSVFLALKIARAFGVPVEELFQLSEETPEDDAWPLALRLAHTVDRSDNPAVIIYIVRRLLLLPIVILGVSILIFALLQLMSPFSRLSVYVTDPDQLKQGREQLASMVEELGLDDPLWVQYGRWIREVLRGNFGWSESARRPVLEAILNLFPASAELALYAAFPVILLGVWLGKVSAVRQDTFIDHSTRIATLIGWSVPTFVFGILLLMVFYGVLDWFPPGRLGLSAARIVYSDAFTSYTGMHTIDAILNGSATVLGDALRHLVLPVLTLASLSWAMLMRLMRSSMLETLRQDYIVTARSKGLPESAVINKHAQRNALLPVTTVAGLMIAGLLNGVVVTEVIFNYRGLGQFAAEAAVSLDTASIVGFSLFNGALLVLTNLVVDVLYASFDPRVRLT
jgi:ABC-type dipeptide/oligopeptide/nickel transport system permease component/DNA-binding XRE family transcriptional regulator